MNRERTYEEDISKLEQLIRRLEKGDISLEESLALFEEGISLIKTCQHQLDRAAEKIQILTAEEGTGAPGRQESE